MHANSQSPHDAPTVAAIAVVAYCLANVVHEGLGHGGACLLQGCRPQSLNAIFFDYDETSATAAGHRWIAAGGGIANLLAAALALAALRGTRAPGPRLHYFLWLFAAVNLLTAFGYLLFSGIGGIGDWTQVVRGLQPQALYRGALAIAGAALYFWLAPRLLAPQLAPFLAAGPSVAASMWRVVRMPYLVGGCTFVVAGLLNPYGMQLVLISAAAASFGGTSLLAWYPFGKRLPAPAAPALVIARSRGWIVAGVVVAILFIGVLGPGLYA